MSFEEKILEMQKDNCTLYTILKYLRGYDCYKLLDEQILLCEILLIYKKHDIKVSKFQIRYCFNKSYNFEAHGDKKS